MRTIYEEGIKSRLLRAEIVTFFSVLKITSFLGLLRKVYIYIYIGRGRKLVRAREHSA